MNETAQPASTATTASTAQPPSSPAEQPQPQGLFGGGMMGFMPIILLFGIFYFMMIRPQQRKEKERQRMISELRAGRKVSFAGGLVGTIVEAKEQTFVIESAGSTVEVARGAVAAVVEDEKK